MGNKIDIRIMWLDKWYVPKSFTLEDLGDVPVILGYFDKLKVKGLQVDTKVEKIHPFTAGYRKLAATKNKRKQELADYSSQEQLLFLNISEEEISDGSGFTQKAVQDFWNDKGSSAPYLYLSMIHICHGSKIKSALQKIKNVFGKDYLSYISFDYCDIVLFAHNMSIPEFLDKIRNLFVVEPHEEKVIFDTFSMVSFWPSYALNGLPQNQPLLDSKEKFQATINISVRDHKKFDNWYDANIKRSNSIVKRYNLYGRHDISITNDKADTIWLMWIMKMLHDKDNQDMFWTFETFVKVQRDNNFGAVSDTSDDLSQVYATVKETLRDGIEQLKDAIEKANIRDKDRYILPVYEVRDCLCSIVKNSFAEEFVCCIYESFLHFVSYMTVEFTKSINYDSATNLGGQGSWEDKIADSYDKYFVALNTLVNSTMHNERQFVQATAFNAVFYSVPPKIMAFYNAYTYRIKQILKSESCENQYTFLIYPSFSPTTALEQISLNDEPPCDRILTVTISEKSLYGIEAVMYQMVHELAHYVGDDLRCRQIRTQKIKGTLLKWVADKCRIENDTYQMLRQFLEEDKSTAGIEVEDRASSELYKFNYLQSIFEVGKNLLLGLADLPGLQAFSMSYYQNKVQEDESFYDAFLDNCGIAQEKQKAYVLNYIKQYSDMKCKNFNNCLKIMDKPSSMEEYKLHIKLMKSVYRECYADLQMILVLAMNAEDYLNTFLVHLEIPAKEMLRQSEDMLRISTIFRVMIKSGLWKEPSGQDNQYFRFVYGCISEYNQKIEAYTEKSRSTASAQKVEGLAEAVEKFDFQNGIHLKEKLTNRHVAAIVENPCKPEPLIDIAAGLYEYLLEVMGKTLEEYSKNDKMQKICQVRGVVNKVLNFKDTIEIFNCVEEEIVSYKRDGCKI